MGRSLFTARVLIILTALLLITLSTPSLSAAGEGIRFGDKLLFEAQMRWRSELDGKDFNGQTAMDEKSTLRTLLGLTSYVSPHVTVMFQMQDARKMGTNSATADPDVNLGIQQGFIEITQFLAKPLYMQVGRFEAYYGRQRIMSVGDWSYRRKYDGVRFGYETPSKFVDLFALNVKDRSYETPANHNDWNLYGAYGSFWKKHVDLCALYDWDSYEVNGADQLQRLTLGHYFNWDTKRWRADFDAAYQTGKQEKKDLAGYMVSGQFTYKFPNRQKTKLGLCVDVTSGDNGSDTTKIASYAGRYGTARSMLGYMDLFTSTVRLGLVGASLRFAHDPVKDLSVALDVLHFQNLELYKAADGHWSNDVGQELDLTVKWKYRPGLALQTGVSSFFPADDWKPGSNLGTWTYAMVTVDL